MPRIKYTEYKPNVEARKLIDLSNQILVDYEKQGYQLTLRQLYYQLVARDIIPNNLKSYNRVKDVISRAREGGMVDWLHIVDRTRNVRQKPHWEDGSDFMRSVAPQFNLDLWVGQYRRPIVFVEKEALEQIVGRAAGQLDVPYFANKGYLSASAVWNVAHQWMLLHPECKNFTVFHLGDHDPSGVDMTRDIETRLALFSSGYDGKVAPSIIVERIALTMDQIDEYTPPPNPAKETDSRFRDYQRLHGDESWELDALEPSVIDTLVTEACSSCINDRNAFDLQDERQRRIRRQLVAVQLDEEL